MKKRKFWAVVDPQGELLQREVIGQPSIFVVEALAHFLAEEWAEPSENLRVVQVEVKIIKNKKNENTISSASRRKRSPV